MDRKQCHCGLKTEMRTSNSPSFPGMRYWGCPNVGEEVCCYIDWIDHKPSKNTIEYIRNLRAEKDDLASQLHAQKAECLMLSQSADNASVAGVLYRKERDDMRHQLRIKDVEINVLKDSEQECKDLAANASVEAHELSEEVETLRKTLLFQNSVMKFIIVIGFVAAFFAIV